MKDAKGHGSNPGLHVKGISTLPKSLADRKRLSAAENSMHNLKTTFHAGNGNNRGGEYGRNVREAYERHAEVVYQITGKRPHIYDR